MSEPRMISIDQAKLLMSVTDPDQPPIRKDWDDHLVHKLAATVVEHSEQIERLQRAFEVVLGEANELAEETYNHMAGPFRPMTGRDYGLTAADMEEQ